MDMTLASEAGNPGSTPGGSTRMFFINVYGHGMNLKKTFAKKHLQIFFTHKKLYTGYT